MASRQSSAPSSRAPSEGPRRSRLDDIRSDIRRSTASLGAPRASADPETYDADDRRYSEAERHRYSHHSATTAEPTSTADHHVRASSHYVDPDAAPQYRRSSTQHRSSVHSSVSRGGSVAVDPRLTARRSEGLEEAPGGGLLQELEAELQRFRDDDAVQRVARSSARPPSTSAPGPPHASSSRSSSQLPLERLGSYDEGRRRSSASASVPLPDTQMRSSADVSHRQTVGDEPSERDFSFSPDPRRSVAHGRVPLQQAPAHHAGTAGVVSQGTTSHRSSRATTPVDEEATVGAQRESARHTSHSAAQSAVSVDPRMSRLRSYGSGAPPSSSRSGSEVDPRTRSRTESLPPIGRDTAGPRRASASDIDTAPLLRPSAVSDRRSSAPQITAGSPDSLPPRRTSGNLGRSARPLDLSIAEASPQRLSDAVAPSTARLPSSRPLGSEQHSETTRPLGSQRPSVRPSDRPSESAVDLSHAATARASRRSSSQLPPESSRASSASGYDSARPSVRHASQSQRGPLAERASVASASGGRVSDVASARGRTSATAADGSDEDAVDAEMDEDLFLYLAECQEAATHPDGYDGRGAFSDGLGTEALPRYARRVKQPSGGYDAEDEWGTGEDVRMSAAHLARASQQVGGRDSMAWDAAKLHPFKQAKLEVDTAHDDIGCRSHRVVAYNRMPPPPPLRSVPATESELKARRLALALHGEGDSTLAVKLSLDEEQFDDMCRRMDHEFDLRVQVPRPLVGVHRRAFSVLLAAELLAFAQGRPSRLPATAAAPRASARASQALTPDAHVDEQAVVATAASVGLSAALVHDVFRFAVAMRNLRREAHARHDAPDTPSSVAVLAVVSAAAVWAMDAVGRRLTVEELWAEATHAPRDRPVDGANDQWSVHQRHTDQVACQAAEVDREKTPPQSAKMTPWFDDNTTRTVEEEGLFAAATQRAAAFGAPSLDDGVAVTAQRATPDTPKADTAALASLPECSVAGSELSFFVADPERASQDPVTLRPLLKAATYEAKLTARLGETGIACNDRPVPLAPPLSTLDGRSPAEPPARVFLQPWAAAAGGSTHGRHEVHSVGAPISTSDQTARRGNKETTIVAPAPAPSHLPPRCAVVVAAGVAAAVHRAETTAGQHRVDALAELAAGAQADHDPLRFRFLAALFAAEGWASVRRFAEELTTPRASSNAGPAAPWPEIFAPLKDALSAARGTVDGTPAVHRRRLVESLCRDVLREVSLSTVVAALRSAKDRQRTEREAARHRKLWQEGGSPRGLPPFSPGASPAPRKPAAEDSAASPAVPRALFEQPSLRCFGLDMDCGESTTSDSSSSASSASSRHGSQQSHDDADLLGGSTSEHPTVSEHGEVKVKEEVRRSRRVKKEQRREETAKARVAHLVPLSLAGTVCAVIDWATLAISLRCEEAPDGATAAPLFTEPHLAPLGRSDGRDVATAPTHSVASAMARHTELKDLAASVLSTPTSQAQYMAPRAAKVQACRWQLGAEAVALPWYVPFHVAVRERFVNPLLRAVARLQREAVKAVLRPPPRPAPLSALTDRFGLGVDNAGSGPTAWVGRRLAARELLMERRLRRLRGNGAPPAAGKPQTLSNLPAALPVFEHNGTTTGGASLEVVGASGPSVSAADRVRARLERMSEDLRRYAPRPADPSAQRDRHDKEDRRVADLVLEASGAAASDPASPNRATASQPLAATSPSVRFDLSAHRLRQAAADAAGTDGLCDSDGSATTDTLWSSSDDAASGATSGAESTASHLSVGRSSRRSSVARAETFSGGLRAPPQTMTHKELVERRGGLLDYTAAVFDGATLAGDAFSSLFVGPLCDLIEAAAPSAVAASTGSSLALASLLSPQEVQRAVLTAFRAACVLHPWGDSLVLTVDTATAPDDQLHQHLSRGARLFQHLRKLRLRVHTPAVFAAGATRAGATPGSETAAGADDRRWTAVVRFTSLLRVAQETLSRRWQARARDARLAANDGTARDGRRAGPLRLLHQLKFVFDALHQYFSTEARVLLQKFEAACGDPCRCGSVRDLRRHHERLLGGLQHLALSTPETQQAAVHVATLFALAVDPGTDSEAGFGTRRATLAVQTLLSVLGASDSVLQRTRPLVTALTFNAFFEPISTE